MRSYGKPDYVVKAKDLNFLTAICFKHSRVSSRTDCTTNGCPGEGGSNGSGPVWVVYVMRAMTSSVLYPKEVLLMVNDVCGGRPSR